MRAAIVLRNIFKNKRIVIGGSLYKLGKDGSVQKCGSDGGVTNKIDLNDFIRDCNSISGGKLQRITCDDYHEDFNIIREHNK